MRESKIAIIIFYFGHDEWYQPFFIESCKRNDTIDFIFFSDRFEEEIISGNIKKYPFSVLEFNELASEKLGFDIHVKSGLKMCDLRPAFGIIFEEYLKGYDFWGYTDTDIIFGRLREFLTTTVLESNDFISVLEHYPSGFFALFRNSSQSNNLFRQSDSYKHLFQLSHNTLFEECGGHYNEVKAGVNILDTECENDTIHHLLEMHKNAIRYCFNNWSSEDSTSQVSLVNGKLVQSGREIILFHFTQLKKNFFFSPPRFNSDSDLEIFEFSVARSGFLSRTRSILYDHICRFKMKIALKVDSMLKKDLDEMISTGRFRYMTDLTFEIRDFEGVPVLETYGNKFIIYKSLIFKEFFFAYQANVYFKFKRGNIDVLLPNGSFLLFHSEAPHS